MNFLSSGGTKLLLLTVILLAAALCVCAGKARGQAEPGPQPPVTTPTEPQPQTQPQGGTQSSSPVVAQPKDQTPDLSAVPEPPELHALVADFREQLRKAGIQKVLLRDFESVEAGHFPLEDWLGDRVAEDLASPPDGLTVYRTRQLKSAANQNGVNLSDTDAQITASVEPGANGMVVKLVAYRTSAATVRNASQPVALTAREVPLSDAMSSGVPQQWKALMTAARTHPQYSAEQESAASQPTCSECPVPHIPSSAWQGGSHAVVRVAATVGPDGRARDVQVVVSGGKAFDDAAVEAVKNWKFKPAMDINGNPVVVRVQIEVAFDKL
jgi:TonB family protein